MSGPENPDQPSFDITQFEAEALTRGAEFVKRVARLAVLETPEETLNPWIEAREAAYDLHDGTQLEVMHEVYDGNPATAITRAKITQPPVEKLGSDGRLRRVNLTRFVVYDTLSEELDPEALADLEKELPPAPELDVLGEKMLNELNEARLISRLNPNYRPAELIAGRTEAFVECKLARGPNFRTEHYSNNMLVETRLAHMAARRYAGERVDQPEYSIAEHKALMSFFAGINPHRANPQPLPYDFDDTWKAPRPSLRTWAPKSKD